MKIRRLFLILFFVILLPFSVKAEEVSGKNGDVDWHYKDGVLTFSTTDDSKGFRIPYVSNPDAYWLKYKDKITKIVINEGIDVIESNAFREYSNLEELILPESMGGQIGDYAFYNCSKLKEVKLPTSMTRIGDYAFYGTSISEVELSIYLDWIYDHTFNENTVIKRPAEYEEILAAGTSGKMKYLNDAMGNGNPNNNTCYNKFYYANFYDDTGLWKLYKDGTLVVTGTELEYGYAGSRVPWGCYKDQIKKIIINDDKTGTVSIKDNVCDSQKHVKLSVYSSKKVADIMNNRIKEIKGSLMADCRYDCIYGFRNLETFIVNRGVEVIDTVFMTNNAHPRDIYFSKYVSKIDDGNMFNGDWVNKDYENNNFHINISYEDYLNNNYSYTSIYEGSIHTNPKKIPFFNEDGSFFDVYAYGESHRLSYEGRIISDVDDTYVSINDNSAPDTIIIDGKTYYKYDTYLTNSDGIAKVSLPNDTSIDYYVKIVDGDKNCANIDKTYKVKMTDKTINEVIENKNKIIIAKAVETDDLTVEISNLNSVDAKKAVRFKVKPIKGYALDRVIITDENSNVIEYKKLDALNEYEFIMPSTNVTIKPEYKKIETINDTETIKNPNTGDRLIDTYILLLISLSVAFIYLLKERN